MDCAFDVCIQVDDEADMDEQVGELLVNPILEECDELNVNPPAYEPFASANPTSDPAPSPTADPTSSPTKSQTHICLLQQEMNCCCQNCDGTPTDKMMETCEADNCSYTSIGDDCLKSNGHSIVVHS